MMDLGSGRMFVRNCMPCIESAQLWSGTALFQNIWCLRAHNYLKEKAPEIRCQQLQFCSPILMTMKNSLASIKLEWLPFPIVQNEKQTQKGTFLPREISLNYPWTSFATGLVNSRSLSSLSATPWVRTHTHTCSCAHVSARSCTNAHLWDKLAGARLTGKDGHWTC